MNILFIKHFFLEIIVSESVHIRALSVFVYFPLYNHNFRILAIIFHNKSLLRERMHFNEKTTIGHLLTLIIRDIHCTVYTVHCTLCTYYMH